MNWENINKEKEPYKVPEGYFESLYSDVLEGKATKASTPFNYKKLITYASLASVLLVGTIWLYQTNTQQPCGSLACLDDESLMHEASQYDMHSVLEYTADGNQIDTSATYLNEIDETALLNEL